MTKKVVLYSYWRSSCSWRVRVALALKGIDYEYKTILLLKNDQCAPEYTALNPMNQVPCLVVSEEGKEDIVLSQSIAIIDYISNAFPEGPSLLPTDPVARAKALMMAEIIASGVQPIQNLAVLKNIQDIAGAEARTAWANKYISAGLTALELHASRHAAAHPTDAFLAGPEPTVADAVLIPQLYNARRFNVDLSPFPRLLAVEEAAAAHPAFIAAHPDKQPDATP